MEFRLRTVSRFTKWLELDSISVVSLVVDESYNQLLEGVTMQGLRVSLPAIVCATLLTACSGGPGTAPIAGMPSAAAAALRTQDANVVDSTPALNTATKKYTLYVPDFGGNRLTTYSPKGKLIETITANLYGPGGVAVDKTGKIYVTNEFGSGSEQR